MSNIVEITSSNALAGPYDIKINGISLTSVLDIDLNGLVSSDEPRHITVSFIVKELVVKKED